MVGDTLAALSSDRESESWSPVRSDLYLRWVRLDLAAVTGLVPELGRFSILLPCSPPWALSDGSSTMGVSAGSPVCVCVCVPAHPCGAPASLIAQSSMRGPMAKASACRLCGRGIEPHGRGSRPAYCRRCTAKADKKAARMPRVDCRECGKAFSTRVLTVRYCSDPCRSAAARRASVEGRRRYDADPEKLALKRARSRLAAAARRARARGDRPPRANRDVKSLKPNPKSAEPYPCALCGRDFAPYGAGRPAYCKRCAAKADREIGRERA